jgi:hypothetical protein
MYRILFWFLFQFKLSKFYYRYPFFTFQNVIVSLMFFCFVGVFALNGPLQLFTLLLFGVHWFCSLFPVERCSEMELVQTCSSTSHLNVSFVVSIQYYALCSMRRLIIALW